MEELVIQSRLDTLDITYHGKRFQYPIDIEIDEYSTGQRCSIEITFDQAKEIRDYLDNILKDR